MTQRPNVTQQIIDYLTQQISSGAWPPGSRIPSEHQLCQLLQASRTSVRSALQTLSTQGCITTVHGKGSFVSEALPTAPMVPPIAPSLSDLMNFIDLFWPPLVAKAALTLTEEELEQLRQIVEQFKSCTVDTLEQTAHLQVEFHLCLAHHFQIDYLVRLVTQIFHYLLLQPCSDQLDTLYYGYIYHYTSILSALEARDPEAVAQALHAYFDLARKYYFSSPV